MAFVRTTLFGGVVMNRLTGYACHWLQVCPQPVFHIHFRQYERFKPGCFKRFLARCQNIRALVGHDPTRRLGSTHDGSLALEEDDTGLRFSLDLGNDEECERVVQAYEAGDVTGVSLGLYRTLYEDTTLPGGFWCKEIISTEIEEVSVVLAPDNPVHTVTRKQLRLEEESFTHSAADRRLRLALATMKG
jgi:HK97 family phage prohead protease